MFHRSVLTIAIAALALLPAACSRRETEAAAASGAGSPASGAATGDITVPPDSPKLRNIRVETVEAVPVPTDEITSPGKVEANPNRVSHVLLPVPGRIARVYVKLGDSVQKGQPLLTLESPDIDAASSAYLQAGAALTQARAALSKAQADLDRTRDLFEHNAVARKELTNAEAIHAQSKAAVDQAAAAMEQTVRRLDLLGVRPGEFGQQMAVRAPVSGKILDMTVVPGEYRNDTSTSVMTIADLSSIWVTSDVPESSIRLVKPGERVDIELTAWPGETFRGRVTQIADTVDPQTRTIKVRAELDNRGGRLRPEMFGRIVLVDHVEPRPLVPAAAVLQSESGNYVIRETEPGHFRQVPVQLGARVGDRIAILSGIRQGDRIVTDGVMLVRN